MTTLSMHFSRSLASIVPPEIFETRSPDGEGPLRATAGIGSTYGSSVRDSAIEQRKGSADPTEQSVSAEESEAGSEPAESLTLTVANELHIEERRRDVRRRSDRDAAATRYLRKL